jgi:hypothetical protein
MKQDLYANAPEHVKNLRKSAMAKQRLKDRKTWKTKLDSIASGSESDGDGPSSFPAPMPRR